MTIHELVTYATLRGYITSNVESVLQKGYRLVNMEIGKNRYAFRYCPTELISLPGLMTAEDLAEILGCQE